MLVYFRAAVLLFGLCRVRIVETSDEFQERYIDCYKDKRDRAMGEKAADNPSMTLRLCSNICQAKQTTFFGVQYYTQCFCADNYNKHGAASNCNANCYGDLSQTCGGSWALSVYWVCPEGFYGLDCRQHCRCLNNALYAEHCLGNGSCPSGCQPGWSGPTCDTDIDQCVSGPCQNSGTCVDLPIGYTCRCAPGYTGFTCQTDIDECSSDPCTNGGSCTDGIDSYTCNCAPGYTDVDCETDIDECSSNPCQHNGVCMNHVNSYMCNCSSGYTGVNCGTDVDECLSTPCLNGGRCTDEVNGYSCTCVPGYTGDTCHTDIDECLDNPCLNGATCEDEVNAYTCHCASGYTGVTCQTIDERVSTSWMFLLLLLLLVVVGVVIVYILIRRRQLAQNKGQWVARPTDKKNVAGKDRLARLEENTNNEKQEITHNGEVHVYQEVQIDKGDVDTSPIYANFDIDFTSSSKTRVRIEDLPELVARINSMSDLLQAEFKKLPLVSDSTCDFAQKVELKPKNRFKNILPYDKNRVKLSSVGNDPQLLSTYINASFIKGYTGGEKLIASHGPTLNTLNDFWRMIWEYNVGVIGMVTKCREEMKNKCEQYWPETCEMEFGGIKVCSHSVEERLDCIVRKMKVSKVGETARLVTQVQFVDWPDHGVPEHAVSLLSIRRIIRHTVSSNQYTLIHCSAGVGRTGTYLAIDYLLAQAAKEHFVDVHEYVKELRDQRMHSVQTLDQYSFIFKAVLEGLTLGETTQSLKNFNNYVKNLRSINPITTNIVLQTEFEMLQLMSPLPQPSDCADASSHVNKSKNRNPDLLPMDCKRVFLQRSNGSSDYINAVYVPGFVRRNAFIATQLPFNETVVDFWSMCIEKKCKVIVCLCTPGHAEEMLAFLPSADSSLYCGNTSIRTTSELRTTDSNKQDNVDTLTVALSHADQTDNVYANTETILQNDAKDRVIVVRITLPGTRIQVRNALKRAHDIVVNLAGGTPGSASSPVVVVSRDGVQHCGQFIAVSNLCDMIKTHQEVDVFQTVYNVKKAQPHFFTDMGEYEELYNIADAYIEQTSVYSNNIG